MNKFLILILNIMLINCSSNNNTAAKIESQNLNKVVIAHRGASGYLPEHTLAAKAMAYAMDVDFIEQDIVLTKDNIPIVIHDIHLESVTDVAEKFPNRKRNDDSYYVIDFTFDELLQLNVSERFNSKTHNAVYAERFPLNKSRFQLHSLQEEIELIQGLNKSTGKNIGIYPEIKEPAFHLKEGKDISKIVLDVLSKYGYKSKTDNCILQCFDTNELKRVRNEFKSNLFLVQLIEFEADEKRLEEFSKYANGIAPWIQQIIKGKNDDGTWKISDLVSRSHQLNLKVHAYTFRADQIGEFNSFEELLNIALNEAKIDGVFTDFPDKVVEFTSKTKQ